MKILFAADMAFKLFPEFPGREQAERALKQASEKFAQADFSVVNLETAMGSEADYTPIIKDGPNIIAADEFLAYCDVLKPSAIGLANNHVGDYGEEAVRHTTALLRENGYPYMGAGDNIEEAYRPAVFEQDGVKAAVIGVCENEFGGAGVDSAGSAGYSLARVTEAIRSAKRNGCVPILYFHGGNEHNPFPSPGKVELYRHFIDLGAGAVVAMHTHCPQGYERYNGCPIVYSMGNFFFPKTGDIMRSWGYGYMTELTLNGGEIGLELIPYRFDEECQTMLEGEEKAEFLRYIEQLNRVIANPPLLKQYFECWSLYFGIGYVRGLVFRPEMEQGDAEMLKFIKNILGCEAHNEVVTTAMRLLYQERGEQAKGLADNIRRLQNMECDVL